MTKKVAEQILNLNRMSKMLRMEELEGIRNLDLRGLRVDVAMRDTAADEYSINIIIHMTMGGGRSEIGKIADAIGKTCFLVLGDQDPKRFDFVFMDKNKINQDANCELTKYHSFCVEIKHPMSKLFELEKLKTMFMDQLDKILDGRS